MNVVINTTNFLTLFYRKKMMITIKLANGKTLESEKGEDIFWFHKSEGRSIVQEPVKEKKEQKK